MLTLSKGFKKPETGDTGDLFYSALSDNMQLLNDHTHDGSDSTLLGVTTQTISSTNWSSEGNDTYSQTLDVTDANANFTVDGITMEFRLSDGTIIYPQVEKQTSTTYKIYINDNTQTLTAVYK